MEKKPYPHCCVRMNSIARDKEQWKHYKKNSYIYCPWCGTKIQQPDDPAESENNDETN